MNYRLLRFLLSVEMTVCYVTEEGLGGGGFAATIKPLPLTNTLKASSFRTA